MSSRYPGGFITAESVDSAAPGQVAFLFPGTFSWTCPLGVTSVSVVCIGGGAGGGQSAGASGGGAGGGLGYKNNIAVVPGTAYTVVVGAPGNKYPTASAGGDSYFISTATVKGGGGSITGSPHPGGTFTGDGGGNGGTGDAYGGGGGAGGYSGAGGAGGSLGDSPGASSTGGGGGGGVGGFYEPSPFDVGFGGGGGGTGVLGAGANGIGGTTGNGGYGRGGSGGADGNYNTNYTTAGGGAYGGGGGGGQYTDPAAATYGARGAVRIIWPGTTRQFPSTNTGDV